MYKWGPLDNNIWHNNFYLVVFLRKFLAALIVAVGVNSTAIGMVYAQLSLLLLLYVLYMIIILVFRPFRVGWTFACEIILTASSMIHLILFYILASPGLLSTVSSNKMTIGIIYLHYVSMIVFLLICIPRAIMNIRRKWNSRKEEEREETAKRTTELTLNPSPNGSPSKNRAMPSTL